MGLSIVKNILDSIKCEIKVESDVDKGTKFTVIFNNLIFNINNIIRNDIE